MNERRRVLADLVADRVLAGAPGRFRLAGLSMCPFLPPGTVVEFRAAAPGEPRVGQLVLVRRSGVLVCHEVASRGSGSLTLHRFLADLDDGPDPAEALVGVASQVRLGPATLAAEGHGLRAWRTLASALRPAARLVMRLGGRVLPRTWKGRLAWRIEES